MKAETEIDFDFTVGTRVMFQEDDGSWVRGQVLRSLHEDGMPLKMLTDTPIWTFSERELDFFFGAEARVGNRIAFFYALNGRNLVREELEIS